MKPRLILLIGLGLVVYFSLSLYHGHQLRKLSAAGVRTTAREQLSLKKREKAWVQVSTQGEQPEATTVTELNQSLESERQTGRARAKKRAALEQELAGMKETLSRQQEAEKDLNEKFSQVQNKAAEQSLSLTEKDTQLTAARTEVESLQKVIKTKTAQLPGVTSECKSPAVP